METKIKIIILVLVILLATSLFIGTRSFNYYCSRVLVGDIGSVAFRWGVEESGFKNCVINTPTLNLFVFILALYAAVFLLHAFLVSQLEEKSCFKNLIRVFLICLLFNFLFYAFSSFFQRISYGFLEGGVSISSGRRWLVSFFGLDTPGRLLDRGFRSRRCLTHCRWFR